MKEMFELNDECKLSIKKNTGLDADKISEMGLEEIDEHLEKRAGSKFKLEFPNNPHLIGRGSVYLYLRRLIKTEEIDKKLSRIKKQLL